MSRDASSAAHRAGVLRLLGVYVEAMMRDEVAPTLGRTAGLDLGAYVGELLARFRNPAIRRSLRWIAWDGL